MTRARDLADSADKDIVGTLTLDGLDVSGNITSSGTVGIGTSSPTDKLHVQSSGDTKLKVETTGTTAASGHSGLSLNTGNGGYLLQNLTTADSTHGVLRIYDTANSAERMRIDSSGNVKISNGTLQIERSGSSPLLQFTDTGVNSRWMGLVDGTSNFTIYGTDGATQELTLDASGNLLVGKTDTTLVAGQGLLADGTFQLRRDIATANSSSVGYISRGTTDGNILTFYKNTTSVGSIGTASSYIYIANGDTGIAPVGGTDRLLPVNGSGAIRDAAIDLGYSGGRFRDLHLSGSINKTAGSGTFAIETSGSSSVNLNASNSMKFTVGDSDSHQFVNGSTEAMRLDSSGNLLVGTTDNVVQTNSGTGNGGIVLRSNNYVAVASDGSAALELNRLASDGEIANFRKDGSTVGTIGSLGGDMVLGTGDVGFRFDDGSDVVTPWNISTNSARNSAIDLGHSTAKFKDAYFSGTVNAANFNTTSDATLKTNVETLSGSLDAVTSLRGVSFDWLDNGGSEIGVIAQEVEAVLPDVVSTNDEGIKSVKYGNMVAVLIEAIKEQQAQIDELKAQLNS